MDVRRIAVTGVLLLSTVTCAGRHRPPSEEAEAAAIPLDVLVLEVENHNWSDVLIYVLHDGMRTRFVEVTATKSATLPIPALLLSSNGTVQLLVHRIGGRDRKHPIPGEFVGSGSDAEPDDYLSPVISVRTGTTVALTLESSLQRSTVGVW